MSAEDSQCAQLMREEKVKGGERGMESETCRSARKKGLRIQSVVMRGKGRSGQKLGIKARTRKDEIFESNTRTRLQRYEDRSVFEGEVCGGKSDPAEKGQKGGMTKRSIGKYLVV